MSAIEVKGSAVPRAVHFFAVIPTSSLSSLFAFPRGVSPSSPAPPGVSMLYFSFAYLNSSTR